MTIAQCPLCERLKGIGEALEGETVWQFPHSVAVLGQWQYYHGYCVLISRRHATELSQLDDKERRGHLNEMCLLARAIERCFTPHKLNYELLGNQVPHLHWHLFPRYIDDPNRLQPVWLALNQAERDGAQRRRLEQGPLGRAETVTQLRNELAATPDSQSC
jgi:diadenosine tetraphosphate (Ap4A) HIT family hydrolase